MADQFLHGVEVVTIDAGPRPVATVNSAIIGLIGTAPNSQAEVKASLTSGTVGANNGTTYTSKLTGAQGNKSSIALVDPKANSQALSVAVNGLDITVKLATSAGGAITTTATQLMAAIAANTAANALVGTASTGASSGAGVVAALSKTYLSGGIDDAFPLNTPVLVAGSRVAAAKLGTAGTLPDAMDSIFDQAGAVVVVVRVAAGVDDAATTANIVGGVNATTGKYEGMQAFLGAESVCGYAPRILIAPGFTHQRTSGANTVVSNMQAIADRLRAVIIADGPSTTDADAYTYAGDFGSKRVYLVDPFVNKTDSNGLPYRAPSSACVAGLIAKNDNENGFWWSPSNQNINGITGTDRAIDFTLGDPNCRANLLNGANIATIIRQNGFRLWGNRTLSSDPKWAFLSVVRTADIINDSLLRAHLWAVDRGITKTYIQDVVDSVNAYLRHLVSIGAILGGNCWADPDLNTPDQIAQGKVYFDFDFTPPFPAEHITFRSHLVNDYIDTIFN
jgi:hypothetical protein